MENKQLLEELTKKIKEGQIKISNNGLTCEDYKVEFADLRKYSEAERRAIFARAHLCSSSLLQ